MDYNKMKLLFVSLICRVAIAQNLNNISYEIKSLFGQPDYRSVNLTWEIEDKHADNHIRHDRSYVEKNFVVNYCEVQSWGEMHRCNSRIVKETKSDYEKNSKTYHMTINNLRMATKYSFHVRPLRFAETEKTARSESFSKDDKTGQKIIVPTKGFSAVATKCLPNESEILVETGPYFSGKIASENGECRIQGNAKDSRESYVMRIDHEKCGSQVSHNDLTVETYITVQENSGILTHSTRRFLVVCTFQPDTLTVRARLALPGKGDVVPESDSWSERERESRNRQFKMVDKSALILKESNENSMENAIGDIENLTEKILSKEKLQFSSENPYENARYSRYSADQKREVIQIEALVGAVIGMALVVLIVFIAFYTIRKDRNREHMEKLQTNSYYN